MKPLRFFYFWINIGYGELIHNIALPIKISILIILHIFLLLALLFPGTLWGLYGAIMTIIAWCYNVIFDRYSRSSWQQKLLSIEKKFQVYLTTTFLESVKKSCLAHLRLTLLGSTAIILATVFMIF